MNQHKKKIAIWVCGAPASGKSRIGAAAILPLHFELIDVDQTYENLVMKYKLSYEHPLEIEEDKGYTKTIQYARRIAEKLSKKSGSEGLVDPGQFIKSLQALVREGKIRQDYIRQLTQDVHNKASTRSLAWDSFRKLILPKMADLDSPLDFLKDKTPITNNHLIAVAREITRRLLVNSRMDHKNLLLVETGGQTGKLVNLKKTLESEGYQTFLIWVSLDSVEEALKRNDIRKASGGRGLDAAIIKHSFQVAQRSREGLLKEFYPHAVEIDNTPYSDDGLQARIKEVNTLAHQWMMRTTRGG